MRERYSARGPDSTSGSSSCRRWHATSTRIEGYQNHEAGDAGTKFAALQSGLRESTELAILVASVGPTALRVDRPSIDARPDQCPR